MICLPDVRGDCCCAPCSPVHISLRRFQLRSCSNNFCIFLCFRVDSPIFLIFFFFSDLSCVWRSFPLFCLRLHGRGLPFLRCHGRLWLGTRRVTQQFIAGCKPCHTAVHGWVGTRHVTAFPPPFYTCIYVLRRRVTAVHGWVHASVERIYHEILTPSRSVVLKAAGVAGTFVAVLLTGHHSGLKLAKTVLHLTLVVVCSQKNVSAVVLRNISYSNSK